MKVNSPFQEMTDFVTPTGGITNLNFFKGLNAAEYWSKKSNGRIQARYISPFAVILYKETANGSEYPDIGKDTWIGHFCIIDGTYGLKIGVSCEISCGVQIYTHTTHKRCTLGGVKEGEPVRIGDHVFIGPNSVISMGTVIEDRMMIPALSFVAPFTTLRKEDHVYRDRE